MLISGIVAVQPDNGRQVSGERTAAIVMFTRFTERKASMRGTLEHFCYPFRIGYDSLSSGFIRGFWRLQS